MKISVLTDINNVIKSYGVCLNEEHNPLPDGIIINTDVDLETIIDRYKLVDGNLIEMTQEEIDALNNQPQEPTAEERLQSLEDAMLFLMLGGI